MSTGGHERAEKLFKEMDTDGDGFITTEELKTALEKNPKVTPENIERAMKMYDKNKDDKISLSEYKKLPIDEQE
ncbi:MAG: EF-hand domain-containing protein [Longispora sp.]|nr:EF-hand domain-containing protein [Longispora sp. (in: high G+C Gram-positive bacteria)]